MLKCASANVVLTTRRMNKKKSEQMKKWWAGMSPRQRKEFVLERSVKAQAGKRLHKLRRSKERVRK